MNQLTKTMKTSEELIKIINDNNLQRPLFNLEYISESFEDNDELCHLDTNEKCFEHLKELGLDNMKEIDGVCNSDEMYVIIHFQNENIYLKLSGEYDSYGGGEHWYEGAIKEVFPKEVTQTIYL